MSSYDIFVFDAALDSKAKVDKILDFVPGTDRIFLDTGIFSKLEAEGTQNANFFAANATGTAVNATGCIRCLWPSLDTF